MVILKPSPSGVRGVPFPSYLMVEQDGLYGSLPDCWWGESRWLRYFIREFFPGETPESVMEYLLSIGWQRAW